MHTGLVFGDVEAFHSNGLDLFGTIRRKVSSNLQPPISSGESTRSSDDMGVRYHSSFARLTVSGAVLME
jgi:hypothetical protein